MSDLQIPLSLEDLEKPSPIRVVALEAFTDILMGVSRDQFAQPNFRVLEILDNPELHQTTFKLVSEVGISDFSIRDLISPNPCHLRKILSGIINFAKFREERLSVFEQCTQQSEEFVRQKALLIEKNQEIAERVNTIRLDCRIVPNPEKLQQALVDMNSSIAGEKAAVTAREKQYRELLGKMEAMGTVQQDLVMCTKLMEECEFEMKVVGRSYPSGFNMFKGQADVEFKVKGSNGEALVKIKGDRTAAKDVWNLSQFDVVSLNSNVETFSYA
ncbi:UNVERIFIED_CONTAM: kinetochore-associated Ndc80 complex subunit nuf2 [Siphonaria sp. JEL0065]|nr:kinetochore-associated Ndc80 complex subunit nuf2 [Siphonaria sp. JEL0065]